MPDPLAVDMAPAAEARQIAFFQRRSPTERMALAFELIAFAVAASRAAIRRARPELDAVAQAKLLVTLQFGAQRAPQVCQAPSIEGVMSIPAAILPVTQAFEQLQVDYFIGGSIASSAYSLPRTTYDVDLIADLQPGQVASFVAQLKADYYIDTTMILDALARRSSFNMTHHATGINIDIFIPAGRPFDRIQFERSQWHTLPGAAQPVKLASPEDVLLNKLAWYEAGNRVSDQQWRDVQGIIRVQGAALDQEYLHHWATSLDLSDLLAWALRGERPPPPASEPQQQPLF